MHSRGPTEQSSNVLHTQGTSALGCSTLLLGSKSSYLVQQSTELLLSVLLLKVRFIDVTIKYITRTTTKNTWKFT